MKLYVTNMQGEKIYLDTVADTRLSLAEGLGSYFFNLGGEKFNVNQVFAEPGSPTLAGGATLGATIGLIAGPIGALIGGIIGGAVTGQFYSNDSLKVLTFNSRGVDMNQPIKNIPMSTLHQSNIGLVKETI